LAIRLISSPINLSPDYASFEDLIVVALQFEPLRVPRTPHAQNQSKITTERMRPGPFFPLFSLPGI
jgi:hypothetical protein